jgi:hypothetical protein
VAIYADDPKSFRIYSKLCGEQYQIGLNPGLTAKHETLVQEARQSYLGVSQETRRALELTTSLAHDGDLFAAVQAQLVGCQSYQELLDGALKLMVDRSGATEGYLYLPRQGELSLVCQKGDQAPTEQAVETMRSAFIRFSDEVRDSESTATATDSTMWRSMDSEYRTVESVMLSVNVFGKTVPVGSVILNVAKAYHHPTDNLFYEAIARCLYDSSYQKW